VSLSITFLAIDAQRTKLKLLTSAEQRLKLFSKLCK